MTSTLSSKRAPLARLLRVALMGSLLGGAGIAAEPQTAAAQKLGPFRQLLAIEPYYTRLELDQGAGAARLGRNGYGGRLWINLAPFTGDSWILPSTGGIAFFVSYAPEQSADGVSVWHYGAQHDLFFRNRPLGGVIDPFVSVAGGAFRTRSPAGSDTRFALSPGGGIRLPLPNRFQLRADVRDAIVFNSRAGAGATERTAHNLEIQAALGLTF